MTPIEAVELAQITGGLKNPREVAMPKGLRLGGRTLPGSSGSPHVVTSPTILDDAWSKSFQMRLPPPSLIPVG